MAIRKRWAVLGAVWLVTSLACAGGQAAPSDDEPAVLPPVTERGGGGRRGRRARDQAPAPTGPSPAFHTFEADGGRYRIVFTSEGARKTWANMSGPAVNGRWKQRGDGVVVIWEPAEHHGSASEEFLVQGDCVLVRAVRVDKSGQRFEDPKAYVKDEPQCQR
ncbi:MAG: hypothetical protein R3F59_29405 [Myxococcota bacterium]